MSEAVTVCCVQKTAEQFNDASSVEIIIVEFCFVTVFLQTGLDVIEKLSVGQDVLEQ